MNFLLQLTLITFTSKLNFLIKSIRCTFLQRILITFFWWWWGSEVNREGHVLSLIFSFFCADIFSFFLNLTFVPLFLDFSEFSSSSDLFSFLNSQYSAYVRYSLSLVGTDWLNVINRLDGPFDELYGTRAMHCLHSRRKTLWGFIIAQTMRVVTVRSIYRPIVLKGVLENLHS